MFRETLLESSSQLRKRRRWPMAAAFSVQMMAAVFLVIAPMVTTGVIPVSARTVVFTPTTYQPHEAPRPDSGTSGTRPSSPTAASPVVQFYNNNSPKIPYGPPATGDPKEPVPDPSVGNRGPIGLPAGCCSGSERVIPLPPPPKKPVPVSVLSEASLINKVVPTYPVVAQHSGVQGDVKLHAIISRDGSIQSLSLISGHPLLAPAAIAAVEQWRYRPYILNGEPVEVETWITVSFKKYN